MVAWQGEVRNTRYIYFGNIACKVLDLRGDFETFKAPETGVLQAETLADGWVRYWLIDNNDPSAYEGLARAYNDARPD